VRIKVRTKMRNVMEATGRTKVRKMVRNALAVKVRKRAGQG